MIARLRGIVETLPESTLIVDVGGVGYRVLVDGRTWSSMESGTEQTLLISTRIREDAFDLFGFTGTDDQVLFERLLTVKSVGPKHAFALLGGLEASDIVRAIDAEDVATLTRIKGIGATIARRIVSELQGKLTTTISFRPTTRTTGPSSGDQFSLALARLGYKRSEITGAHQALAAQGLGDASLEDRLRAALRYLSRTE